jgi:hypothetical protein
MDSCLDQGKMGRPPTILNRKIVDNVLSGLFNRLVSYRFLKTQNEADNPKEVCLAVLYIAYEVFTSDFYNLY